MTSAVLETFGDMSDMRIFYDGKHSDFIDTYDRLLSTSEGTFNMALDVTGVDASVNKYGIGSNWEAEVQQSTQVEQTVHSILMSTARKLLLLLMAADGKLITHHYLLHKMLKLT